MLGYFNVALLNVTLFNVEVVVVALFNVALTDATPFNAEYCPFTQFVFCYIHLWNSEFCQWYENETHTTDASW